MTGVISDEQLEPLVFPALEAFFDEREYWRILELHNPPHWKAIRDRIPTRVGADGRRWPKDLPSEATVSNEVIRYMDFSDKHAAQSFIQFHCMKAALALAFATLPLASAPIEPRQPEADTTGD